MRGSACSRWSRRSQANKAARRCVQCIDAHASWEWKKDAPQLKRVTRLPVERMDQVNPQGVPRRARELLQSIESEGCGLVACRPVATLGRSSSSGCSVDSRAKRARSPFTGRATGCEGAGACASAIADEDARERAEWAIAPTGATSATDKASSEPLLLFACLGNSALGMTLRSISALPLERGPLAGQSRDSATGVDEAATALESRDGSSALARRRGTPRLHLG